MLDLKFVRENPEAVKQNIRNKFQDNKLPLVDEVIELDELNRAAKQEGDALRAERNKLSKQIGGLMGQGKREEAEELKKQVTAASDHLAELEEKERELDEKIKKIMMTIPNIIFGFYGMNIGGETIPGDFFWWIPLLISAAACFFAWFMLKKKNLY